MRPPDRDPLHACQGSAALELRVLGLAQSPVSPPRPSRLGPLLLRAALAAAAMAAVVQAFGGPALAAGRTAVSAACVLAGAASLAVAVTGFTLRSRGARPPARRELLGIAVGVPLVAGALALACHASLAGGLPEVGLRCLAVTALSAPWPFLALLSLGRRLDLRQPALAGAAIGATAAAWVAVTLEVACPLSTPVQILVGRVLPLAAVSLAGAAYGRRRLGLRRVK
jgi:hypothetical protein